MGRGKMSGEQPDRQVASDTQDAILAVDVNDGQTHIGLFERDVLVDDWWTETRADATPDALASDLAEMLAIRNVGFENLRGSIVSSTVPNLSHNWPRAGEKCLGHSMLVVGTALRSGMPVRIEHPGELGANRLVNAVAAYERVGRACIVVDFSTAIAFDIVSRRGEYVGSMFAPGFDISFDRFAGQTATLPPTPKRPAPPAGSSPAPSTGTDKVAALRSGTVYGAAGLCDGIVARIQLEMDEKPTVLATGPRAPFITEFCDTIEDVDTSLTLEGLRIIHARNS